MAEEKKIQTSSEINEIEKRKTTEKVNAAKSWLYERSTEVFKNFNALRKKILTNKIKSGSSDITVDSAKKYQKTVI